MNLYSPKVISDIKELFGFKLSKSLGQNFLTDKNVIDKIIDGAGICEEDLVIEIGPGIGVLTQAAAERAAKVIAVEIDSNLIPILSYTLNGFNNIEVINEDILKLDVNSLIEKELAKLNKNGVKHKVKVMGNLPYYITTPIIMKLLEDGIKAECITVMMQKEVAERIESGPGGKEYGAISVAVQYYSEVSMVAKVPKDVFYPAPKVDSAVLRLDLRKEKDVDLVDESVFFACIKAGFGQRRKTLFNSLSGVCGLDKEKVASLLDDLGIDGIRRAETLSISEFGAIANAVAKLTL